MKDLEVNIMFFDESNGKIVNAKKGPSIPISKKYLKKVIENPEMIGLEIPAHDIERGQDR